MKTALIIGGTKGFGKEIYNLLKEKNFNLITIGRTSLNNKNHFECDIFDSNKFKKFLIEIKNKFKKIDLIICVVGFASLEKNEIERILYCNFTYIQIVFSTLKENLLKCKNPRFISFSSRWANNLDFNEMFIYSIAKRALRDFINQLNLDIKKIKSFNIQIPLMKTPGLEKVIESFIKNNKIFPLKKIENSKKIAQNILKLFL